jgi:hypothetical protein
MTSAATGEAHAVDFHGLHIAWAMQGLASDPVRELFHAFPRIPEGDARRTPDVELRVAARDTVLAPPRTPEEEGFAPSFRQGNLLGYARGQETLILGPATRVTIAADGTRVDAVVDAATIHLRGLRDATLVIALSLALRHHGLFHLHAGALVREDGRRVVVLGDSGAGKSTVTLTLLGPGARHLGDDTLYFTERRGAAPRLLAFPRPFHLGAATARAFPTLAAVTPHGDLKRHVALDDLPGARALQMDAPHVLLFPHVTGEKTTRVVEISRSDAFGLALRSCAFVVIDGVGQREEQLALLGTLVKGARAFELNLGADWLEAPARTANLVPWATCPAPDPMAPAR